jgi:Eukaryotic cytochrome b561
MFHMICHIGSLTCLIVGLTAIIKMKEWQATEYNKYDVMFTGHSWMGVTTVSLWMLQFIFAVWLRMLTKWPPGTEDRKAVYAEAHRFMGYTVYAMGLASCATGFQDMQSYDAAALISGGGGGHGRRLHNFHVTEGDVNTGYDLSIPQPGDDARLASVGESLYNHFYSKSHCSAVLCHFILFYCFALFCAVH